MAWSCANDGDAIGISREDRFGWGRVAFSRRQRALLVIVGGPSRCTLTGGDFSRKMAGEMGAEGAETGARGGVRGEVRLPARWCAVSRVALVLARLDDVSARRKVAPWKLRDQEGEFASRLGARAMLRVSPRARPTNRCCPRRRASSRVVRSRAVRSDACARRSAAPSGIVAGGRAPKPDRCRKKEKGGNETRCCAPLGEIVSCTRRSDSRVTHAQKFSDCGSHRIRAARVDHLSPRTLTPDDRLSTTGSHRGVGEVLRAFFPYGFQSRTSGAFAAAALVGIKSRHDARCTLCAAQDADGGQSKPSAPAVGSGTTYTTTHRTTKMSVMGAVAPVRAQHAAGFAGGRLSTRARAVRASVARRVVAKAVAEASVAQANKAEWNSLGSVCAVLGSQWGDEGKGKLVDILAQVRFSPRSPDAAGTRGGSPRRTNGVPSRRARVPTAPRARTNHDTRRDLPTSSFTPGAPGPRTPSEPRKRVGGDGNLSWLRSSRQRTTKPQNSNRLSIAFLPTPAVRSPVPPADPSP